MGTLSTWGRLSPAVWTELPRTRGARTASLRADVAAAAGRITLPALCWYPLETGLRREAAEVPVVNVGSPHSRRGLSHEGDGRQHSVSQAGAGRTRTACLLPCATLPPPCSPPGAPEAPNVICLCVISVTAIPAAAGSLGGPGTLLPEPLGMRHSESVSTFSLILNPGSKLQVTPFSG